MTLRQDWAALRERPDLDELIHREREVGQELLAEGTVVRIWRLPGERANVAIWSAPDATALHAQLARLPCWPWLHAQVVPLATHDLERSC